MRYTNLRYRSISYAITTVCIGSLFFNAVLSQYVSKQNEKISELNKEVVKLKSRLELNEIKKKAEIRRLTLDELFKRIDVDNTSQIKKEKD